MRDKKQRTSNFAIGDRIRVNLQGNIFDATIREVLSGKDGSKLKVDLGLNKVTVVERWQVVKY